MARAIALVSGPALVGWTLAVVAVAALFFLRDGLTEDGLLHLIRGTARLSAFVFSLAFLGPGARRVFPSRGTAWIADNEPWLLGSLVASHLCHAAAILGSAWITDGASMAGRTAGALAAGAAVYLVLLTLGISSMMRLGQERSRPHRMMRAAALYLLWLVFFQSYVRRPLASPLFAVLAILLALGLALRVAAALRDRAASVEPA